MDCSGLFRIFPVLLLSLYLPGAEAAADTTGVIAGVIVVAVLILIIVGIVTWYFVRSKKKRDKLKKNPPVFANGSVAPGQKPEYAYPGPYMEGGYGYDGPYMIPTKTVETYYAPVAPPPQMIPFDPEMYSEPRSSRRERRSERAKSEERSPSVHQSTPPPSPPPAPKEPDFSGPAVAVIRHQQTMESKRSQYETKTTSLKIDDDGQPDDVPDDEYVRETIMRVPPHVPVAKKEDDYVIVDYVDHNNRNSTIVHNISTSSAEQRSSFETPESSSTPREVVTEIQQVQVDVNDIEDELNRRQRIPDLTDVRL